MLTFVGLGLFDERSVTVEGADAIRDADTVVLETYTSRLTGTSLADLEAYHGVSIEPLDRSRVEQDPESLLKAARKGNVAFLVGGDPMMSTTHVDLRLRAHRQGLETRLVHGTSAATAAAGLSGLQNYRFGRATTLPFPNDRGVPGSVLDAIESNRARDIHTLVYLDIDVTSERYLSASVAAEALADAVEDVLGVVIARAGSADPTVEADRLSVLAGREFGEPLHLLIIPGALHRMEAEALRAFAGAPATLTPVE